MNKKSIIFLALGIFICCGCSKVTNISSIKGVWEPESTVYLNFGYMTVKDNLIVWKSGQRSSFKIISNDKKGIVLQFTDKILPRFHGDAYKFIRFVPKLDKMTQESEVEVSFYEESRRLNDENAMWGVYVKVN